MPTKTKRRGVIRYRGVVTMDGKIVKKKWFGQGREEQRKAILWEDATKRNLLKEMAYNSSEKITLVSWYNKYLDYVESIQSKKTYDEKRSSFKRFLDAFGDTTRVEEIEPVAILDYMSIQASERSGNAANKDRKNLSAGWNWAKEFLTNWPLNHAHSNPFMVVPRRKEERLERYVPSEEDFWKVVDLAKGQDKVILTAAYYLAARRGELWRLQWHNVDLKNKRVCLGTMKTVDGLWKHVWLPMVDDLYQSFSWQWKKARTNAHNNVFWSQAENLEHFGNPFVARQKWLEPLCEEAEVKPFGMHAIRHLRAIRLYKDNATLGSIQKWLRHDKPSTTEVYLKKFGLDLDNLLEVAEASARSKVVNTDKRQ